MAITKVFSDADNLNEAPNGLQRAIGTIAGPASYATNGFAADIKTDLGLDAEPSAVIVQASNGMTCTWDSSAKKIKVFGSLAADAATELTAAENLSAVTFTILAFWVRT